MTAEINESESRRKRSRLRRLLFYFLTIAMVISPLVAIELVLRLFVPLPAPITDDPYISFTGMKPLFVLDPATGQYTTANDRLVAFRSQSFAAQKGQNTFRVFCLGGSTVQGRPYSVETSFTSWLELDLHAARPNVDYEVVNCGGISYASYRLVPIMRELLQYEPDLFIIYTGHNEFLEDRTYAPVKQTPRVAVWAHETLMKLRSYSLAHHYLVSRRIKHSQSTGQPKTMMSPQVKTMLDLEEGLSSYHRDDAWRAGVIEHFSHNLETMVAMARSAAVPIILVNPVSNLKDCPPFKSEPGPAVSEADAGRVAALREQAAQLDWSDAYGKIRLLDEAVAIDDRDAGLLFSLGRCYYHLARYAEAKQRFVRAKEQDVCPLRIVEPMHAAISRVCSKHKVPLVDARKLIEQQSEGEIAGNEWLLDHVHPTINGHKLIADALFKAMESMRFTSKPEGWQQARDELWQRHLESLDDTYYAHGAARLKRLTEWSRGRIPKEAQLHD